MPSIYIHNLITTRLSPQTTLHSVYVSIRQHAISEYSVVHGDVHAQTTSCAACCALVAMAPFTLSAKPLSILVKSHLYLSATYHDLGSSQIQSSQASKSEARRHAGAAQLSTNQPAGIQKQVATDSVKIKLRYCF